MRKDEVGDDVQNKIKELGKKRNVKEEEEREQDEEHRIREGEQNK